MLIRIEGLTQLQYEWGSQEISRRLYSHSATVQDNQRVFLTVTNCTDGLMSNHTVVAVGKTVLKPCSASCFKLPDSEARHQHLH